MIYTVGHSTLDPDEFLSILGPVDGVVDVRSFPGSRRYPHFRREAMEDWLPAAGIRYEWRRELGGRRRLPEGVDVDRAGWHTEGFAAYAWHTAQEEWMDTVEELMSRAGEDTERRSTGPREDLALMCAEALWWRCHRSMIADYLVWRGVEVIHLQPEPRRHSEAVGDRLERYPPEVLRAWSLAGARGSFPSA